MNEFINGIVTMAWYKISQTENPFGYNFQSPRGQEWKPEPGSLEEGMIGKGWTREAIDAMDETSHIQKRLEQLQPAIDEYRYLQKRQTELNEIVRKIVSPRN